MGKRTENYEFLSIKVDRFDFAIGESINVDLRTRRPWELSDDDPVVTPVMRIEITGTSIYPEARANDTYNITVYAARTPVRLSFGPTRCGAVLGDVRNLLAVDSRWWNIRGVLSRGLARFGRRFR